jgi:hypothetical protein
MNSDGSIAEETKYNNTLAEAEIFACSMVKKYEECMAVCESTTNLWLKTYGRCITLKYNENLAILRYFSLAVAWSSFN